MRRNTGSMGRLGSGMRLTAQAARRLMIALTILGVVTLAVGASFSLVQRASAATDVCPIGCTYTSIQAAINAASSGATITVGPGTYNEAITINKDLALVGPNASVDPVTTARSAEAIIDANGKGPFAVTIASANVTVNGFTIENGKGTEVIHPGPPVTYSFTVGAGITGSGSISNASIYDNIITDNYNGIWELYGTTITIKQNAIQDNSAALYGDTCFHGAPFCNGIFNGGPFTTMNVLDNAIDESGLPTDFSSHFQRAMSISSTIPATLNIDGNSIYNSTTLANLTGEFTNNSVSGDFGVRLIGGVNSFAIANNTFSGLFSNAIVSHVANNSNLSVVNNTITQNIGDIQYFAGWVYNGSDDAAIDLDKLTGPFNNISENTITYSGSNGFPNASVEGIRLRSGVTGTVNINSNTFDGGNVGGPDTTALELDAGATLPTGTVDSNIFRRFTTGVNDLNTASLAYTLGQNNCISGNSLDGYASTLSAPNAVNAQQNWWGSALGPGTSIGYGNPVTLPQVDASNFLTTAPMVACGGPVVTNTTTSAGNPIPISTAFTVKAHLSTVTTSDAPIASAYYTIDGGSPVAMVATGSASFNVSKKMNVEGSASEPGYPNTGNHTVCVYGMDIYGQIGSKCFTLKIVKASTTTTVTSGLNPSAYGDTVTFTITVASAAGAPTGTVALTDNAAALAGPLTLAPATTTTSTATYTTSALAVGTHPLVATYTPDVPGKLLFKTSTSATLNQVVNLVGTRTTVTGAPNPSVSGQTVTFTLKTVAADASALTGSVVLKDGATTLATVTLTGGVGTYSTSALSVGAHNITASYSGDATHAVSTGAATQTVAATPAVPTGSNNAYIRIVQSSEAYTSTDIAIDGATTFPNVAACTAQPYYPISSGKHTFTVQTPSGGSTVITEALTLTAGQYYTLAVVGNSAKSITPALLVFEDDNSVTSNQAKSRVYHLSDTLGAVQATAGSTTLAANLAFGNATSYTNQAPGAVTYSFQPSSGPALTDTLNESANQVYSIFLMCNSQVTNAAATGVPVALPQTGYGPSAFWLNPLAARALLIIGALLLLLGLGGFGSYFVIARRRALGL